MASEGALTFHWADYLVFAASLAISVIIGLVQGIRDKWGMRARPDAKSAETRDLHPVPTILSTVATALSAAFVLGLPAEVYYVNSEVYWFGAGIATGGVLSVAIFISKMYDLKMPNIFVVRKPLCECLRLHNRHLNKEPATEEIQR